MKRRIVIPALLLTAVIVIVLQMKRNSLLGGSGGAAAPVVAQAAQPAVQMVAVTVLPPEKKAEPPKEAKPPKEQLRPAKPVKATSQGTAKSQAKLGKQDGMGSGEPNFYANYELAISEYLIFMRSRGAKVLVYDLAGNKPVCEVDGSGKILQTGATAGFSTNSRRITDDYPGGEKLIRRVEQQFGRGSFEILLLLPVTLVDRLSSQVRQIVKEQGLSYKDITTVFLAYRGSRSNVSVYVDKVAAPGGTRQIGASFQL